MRGEAFFEIKEMMGAKEVRDNSEVAKVLLFYFLSFLHSQESSFIALIPGFPS